MKERKIIQSPACHIGRADSCLEMITAVIAGLEIDVLQKRELLQSLVRPGDIHEDIMTSLC